MIRYQALDKCFRNKYRRFYMKDLIDACNEAVYNLTGIDPNIQRRQIYTDISYMESSQGWAVLLNENLWDGKKRYYRYQDLSFSINKRPLDDKEMDMLTQAIATLSRFKGLPQFEWMETLLANLEDKFYLRGNNSCVIGFEQNIDYLASKHLSTLFVAIVNKQVIRVQYRKFSGEEIEWSIHPYFIKQYNNRWFLFGLNSTEENEISVIPLDRIKAFESDFSISYIGNESIDFDEYFDDVIGVTIPKNMQVEKIRLKFSMDRLPYVVSKPLHGSMVIKDKEQGFVELRLIPNREFEAVVMSFGNSVEVLEPEWLREQIMRQIEGLAKKYDICAHQMHT